MKVARRSSATEASDSSLPKLIKLGAVENEVRRSVDEFDCECSSPSRDDDGNGRGSDVKDKRLLLLDLEAVSCSDINKNASLLPIIVQPLPVVFLGNQSKMLSL